VKQPDEETPRTYKLTRDVVPIASVSPVGYADAHGVACIQINQVKSSTVHELREIEASLDSATEVVALDFRALGDFDLHNGKLLANALIDGGLVGTAESVSGSEKFTAEPGRLFTGRELVVLIGPDTIGTPEWIAAALQDLQQAKLLGAPTSGQGHGQFIETVETSVPDLLVTIPIGRLRRANGVSLQLTTDERKSLTKIEMPKSTFFDFKSITAALDPLPGGVQPDIGDISWTKPSGGRDSESAPAMIAKRVARLLNRETAATPAESGQ
jgi:C-terminal processing protease CtpA/Prc